MLDLLVLSIPQKTLEIAATGFLVLLVLGGALIGPHNQLPCRGCAPLPMKSLGKMPMMQVELARCECDLEKVLTPGSLECNLKDAEAGNMIDSFLFIPAYSGLLMTIGLILARGDQQWRALLLLLVLVAVPVAALCDWTENHGITLTIQHFRETGSPKQGDAARISRPSLVKWSLTALVLLLYGVAALRRLGTWNWPLAVIGVFGAGLGLLLLITLIQYFREPRGP